MVSFYSLRWVNPSFLSVVAPALAPLNDMGNSMKIDGDRKFSRRFGKPFF
jgi:hypothetical protein